MPSALLPLVALGAALALTGCRTPGPDAARPAAAGSGAPRPAAGPAAPLADHHQHLFSPGVEAMFAAEGVTFPPLTARDVVGYLDAAGIRRALVLSVAYLYGSPDRSLPDEYERVRAENDWAGAQAAAYPGRLRAFCSFNPLRDYALDELARCADDPRLHYGIKLHFGNSDVRLDRPDDVERLRAVFRAANARGMAIVVHLRASVDPPRPYGAAEARVFLDDLLPLAPDVPVQVAHFAGTGPGYEDPPSHEAMDVLAAAVERGDPHTARLLFDVASLAVPGVSDADLERIARRIRQVGVDRVLYGSDSAVSPASLPGARWAAFRTLPLTEAEFARIATHVAPYLQ